MEIGGKKLEKILLLFFSFGLMVVHKLDTVLAINRNTKDISIHKLIFYAKVNTNKLTRLLVSINPIYERDKKKK